MGLRAGLVSAPSCAPPFDGSSNPAPIALGGRTRRETMSGSREAERCEVDAVAEWREDAAAQAGREELAGLGGAVCGEEHVVCGEALGELGGGGLPGSSAHAG